MTRTLLINVLDFRAVLLDGFRAEFLKRRPGIHGSQMADCARKACFEAIYGQDINELTMMYFLSGKFIHEKLESILGPEFDIEKEIIWNDIAFTPDIVWKPQNVVIDFKTARTDSVIKEAKPGHVKQLKMYMAILNAPYGILQYIIMNKYDKDLFPNHYFTLEHDEREQILEQIVTEGEELRAGIDLKDPSLVRHIANDKRYFQKLPSGYEYNWLCKVCAFKKECDEMRAKAGEFQKRIEDAQKRETFSETSKRLFTEAQKDVHRIVEQEMMKIPESWRPK